MRDRSWPVADLAVAHPKDQRHDYPFIAEMSWKIKDKPLTADELIENAERKAASDAIKTLAERHVSQLLEVQEQFPLENVDLLSSKIASNHGIPADIRQKITDFQKKMRSVIEEVAARIEERNYKSAQEAISAMRMGKAQKAQVSALMLADKKVHVSCQSLKVAVDVFSEANRTIIDSLEKAKHKATLNSVGLFF